MKKIILVFIFSSIISGCNAKPLELKVNKVVAQDDYLSVDFIIDKNSLKNIEELSSKKIKCKNENNPEQLVQGFITKINDEKIESEIEICENSNNRSCKPTNIVDSKKNVLLSCQVIFSSMIGNVYKSNFFKIDLKYPF